MNNLNLPIGRTIIIDTREHDPYMFDGIQTIRQKLDAGDYSLYGAEHRIAIERKGTNDWVSTIIHNQKRFAKELLRLAQMEKAYIIIECSVPDIWAHRYHGGAAPLSVINGGLAIMQQYNVPIFYAGNRQLACHCTKFLLERFPL